jgi:hypothetical protein
VATAACEVFDLEKLKVAFGIPNDHTVCTLLTLGYAAEEAPFPGRLELDEVCFAEHFGQPWVPDPT